MPRAKAVAWVEYEKLAAQIIKELSPFATVTHDDHIVGSESEARRQIDVTVRWVDGTDERLMIVQVRERRADVNVIGEFRSVITDVQADRGILICSGGFSKNAQTYARNIGIDLYSLTDAKSKRWELELKMTVLWHRITPVVDFDAQMMVVEARSRSPWTKRQERCRSTSKLTGLLSISVRCSKTRGIKDNSAALKVMNTSSASIIPC